VTLGLRATVVENGVGQTYSARYYNPLTGKFVSRDPEDGIPTDPRTLHKYLYAGGDPVNAKDPTGRDTVGVALIDFNVALKAGLAAAFVAWSAVCALNEATELIQGLYTDLGAPIQSITFGFCSADVKKNSNCSAQEVQTCQTLYPNCKGSQCGSCLSYCLTQCYWPYHKPACNKWKFPKDWNDFPKPPKWIN
jgi:RHS repeat-associated protein